MNRAKYNKNNALLRVAVAPQGHSAFLRSGFATITALALLSLVGTALATMTLAFAADARRTVRESTEAQLRQLVFVGRVCARQLKQGESPTNLPIHLPSALTADGGALLVHLRSSDKSTIADIDARYRSSHVTTDVEK